MLSSSAVCLAESKLGRSSAWLIKSCFLPFRR